MKFNTKYLIAAISLLIVGAILYYFSDIVTYILIAWVISMIGAPVVVFLRKYLGKNLAAIITLGLFVFASILIFWTFIPPLVNQVENLSKVDYNKVVTALEEPIKDWEKWLVKKKLMLAPETPANTVRNQTKSFQTQSYTHAITIDSTITGDIENPGKTLKININLNTKINDNNGISGDADPQSDDFFTILKSNINTYINPEKIQQMLGDSLNAFGDIIVVLFSIFFIGFSFYESRIYLIIY
ncbi:MAG: AI-2E family transporter [Saprospiraceae bacterium]|nr:AI-2E family transporter [Saprospiraceae bacterium]